MRFTFPLAGMHKYPGCIKKAWCPGPEPMPAGSLRCEMSTKNWGLWEEHAANLGPEAPIRLRSASRIIVDRDTRFCTFFRGFGAAAGTGGPHQPLHASCLAAARSRACCKMLSSVIVMKELPLRAISPSGRGSGPQAGGGERGRQRNKNCQARRLPQSASLTAPSRREPFSFIVVCLHMTIAKR